MLLGDRRTKRLFRARRGPRNKGGYCQYSAAADCGHAKPVSKWGTAFCRQGKVTGDSRNKCESVPGTWLGLTSVVLKYRNEQDIGKQEKQWYSKITNSTRDAE